MAKKRYNVESDKQQRFFSEEIADLAKDAKGLEDVYARLAMNSRKVADSTEKAKDNFQDRVAGLLSDKTQTQALKEVIDFIQQDSSRAICQPKDD